MRYASREASKARVISRVGLILLAVVAVFLSACSVREVKTPPVAEIASAETVIESALRAGAGENAQAEIAQAQNKIEQAHKASDREEYLTARRYAEQAMVDAQLAEAKARHAERSQTLNEIKEGINTLERELNRS